MTTVEIWIAFFGMMIVTLIARGFFLLAGSKFHISETVQEFLRYAPTAALIAIILPEALFAKNASTQLFELNLYSPQLFGGIAGVIGFAITKSMLITIFFGMFIFTVARLLIA